MKWFKTDFSNNSEYLVIAFSSFFKGEFNQNKFEWEKHLNEISTIVKFKKLYVKDIEYAWWQTKFDGLSSNGPHILANFLLDKVKECDVKRVLTIGASLGGYASILFTCLCKFDFSIAISPQTFLSNYRYKKYKLYEKFKGLNIKYEETDLKNILEKYHSINSRYKLFYGKFNKADESHINRISQFPGVEVISLNSDKHTVAKIMRDEGIISDIIIKFVNGELV